ncbi:MAG: hypothetical protein R3A45_12995 [Bdellovibrionota bacterium]
MNASVETMSKLPPEQSIQTEILGEYYFRKNKLNTALEIFLRLNKQDPYRYKYCYYLGKIYYRLGNLTNATDFLCKAKEINPLHRQTLLLLHHCYSRQKEYENAFECILDLYILAKEVKDQHIDYYEKRIRSTSRKIADFTLEKKAEYFKQRIKVLKAFFGQLEKNLDVFQTATFHHTEELSPDMGRSIRPLDSLSDFSDDQDDEGTDPFALMQQSRIADGDTGEVFIVEEGKRSMKMKMKMILNANRKCAFRRKSLASIYSEAQEAKVSPVLSDAAPIESLPHATAQSPAEMETHLARIAFLRQLPPAKLEKIQHYTSILTFQDGETIFAENDPVFGFHILLEGETEVRKGNENIHYYSSPNILDEDDFFRVNYRSFHYGRRVHRRFYF